MASIFTLRNLGVAARAVAQQAGRSRPVGALLSAGRTTAQRLGHVMHVLWLEVTGFVFLAIASIGAIAFFREYGKFARDETTVDRVLLAASFTVLFAWFGVSSFWRVRKKNSKS
jgi:hypothetical protein